MAWVPHVFLLSPTSWQQPGFPYKPESVTWPWWEPFSASNPQTQGAPSARQQQWLVTQWNLPSLCHLKREYPLWGIKASNPTEPRSAGLWSTLVMHLPAVLWRPKLREQHIHRSRETFFSAGTQKRKLSDMNYSPSHLLCLHYPI